ncbi:methyltransferase [Actinophytocola sp.]|uniref:methyltransferase n=1 Tax=Actinophytocola sp. TaxID=1872138 RepID=UPI0025C263AF|nr:methyltransferase [Actinophytocola sp.]
MVVDDEVGRLSALADLVTPMAIRVAATLRIADRLDGGRTAAEVAEEAGADPDALDRLLRHLVGVGLLRHDGTGRYGLTARAASCATTIRPGCVPSGTSRDRPVAATCRLCGCCTACVPASPRFRPSTGGCTGRTWPPTRRAPRRSTTPAARRWGWRHRTSWPPTTGARSATWSTWAGGNGALLIALLNEFPALCGRVLDLPGTAETARKLIDAAGLSDRADAVSGDFFEPLPAGAEGYLLSAVIHNWGDADARRILRRCADAAGADGAVFVIERVAMGASTSSDLRNLAWLGGRIRDVIELTALAESVGLVVAAVHTSGEIAVLELTSP